MPYFAQVTAYGKTHIHIYIWKLRYREGVFEIGEWVVTMGTAMREHAVGAVNAGDGYRGAAQRFVLGPLPGGSIMISDDSALTETSASRSMNQRARFSDEGR